MTNETPTIDDLAAALRAAAPTLDPAEQRLVVALYRALAEGSPVPAAALGHRLGTPDATIEAALDRWPGVYRNDNGDVIGFWGIAVDGMPHRLTVDGAAATAWCALDPFLIAPLLDAAEVEVRSTDPVTGEPVTMAITPDGIARVEPLGAVMSMVAPDGPFDHDVVQSFCHFVWFFAGRESGEQWIARHPGTFLLGIAEADEAARRAWPALVRDALEAVR